MQTALAKIHDTYRQRCDNPDQQKSAWRKIIAPTFPPDLDAWPKDRPSLLIARDAGDLGCAMLWIVQAALVRPCLALIKQQGNLLPEQNVLLESISDIDCGALAHSEPRDEPVIITDDDTGLLLNGVKKYITGGHQADFIFITTRAPKDEKTSHLLLLPITAIDLSKEMISLDLKSLDTITHGRLTLKNKAIPGYYRMPLSPSLVRKALLVNSLVERSLIMEAVIGSLSYLNHRLDRHMGNPPTETEALAELLSQQKTYSTATIREAQAGDKVQPQWVDLNAVNTAIGAILDAAENVDATTNDNPDNDLTARINDLRFIRSLWGG